MPLPVFQVLVGGRERRKNQDEQVSSHQRAGFHIFFPHFYTPPLQSWLLTWMVFPLGEMGPGMRAEVQWSDVPEYIRESRLEREASAFLAGHDLRAEQQDWSF